MNALAQSHLSHRTTKQLFQLLTLKGHTYRVTVKEADQGWQAFCTCDNHPLFGPVPFRSEAEARQAGHCLAYAYAGMAHLDCTGDCHPWRPIVHQDQKQDRWL